MPPTFAQLKEKLRDWSGVPVNDTQRFPVSVRGDCLNLSRRDLLRTYDLRFGETSDTFPTVAGTKAYALPAGWSRPLFLWYVNPDNANEVVWVKFRTLEKFNALHPSATDQGDPVTYTVWGGDILLGPTPSRAITLNRDFYKILADLDADGDEDDFTVNAWETILFRALAEYAPLYLIEDPRIPAWKQRARDLENKLVIEHSRAANAGAAIEIQEPG